MRKILLGTTAVCGAALMGMSVAQAQTAPTVRVGGYFEFTGGYVNDDFDRNSTFLTPGTAATVNPVAGGASVAVPGTAASNVRARRRIDFRSDMELNIFITGKAANGLSYGAQIELQMDNVTNGAAGTGVTGSVNSGNGGIVDTDEFWGFISSPTLGTFQFGDQDSAADQLKVAAPSVTNLGESGGWDEFIAPAADGTRYILSTINDGSDATKIIYLSPQFFGFDFGVSYAPNGFEGENYLQPNSTGNTTLQRNPNGGSIRNEISGAVRYRGSFGNVGVAAAFSAMRGDAPSGVAAGFQNPNAYQAGLNVAAFGFTLGGHYVWGDYAGASFGRTGLANGLDQSYNYTIGLTYAAGPLQVGTFYSKGSRDNVGTIVGDREQRAYGFGAVYTLAPGLEMFANYTRVEDENVQQLTNATAGSPGQAAAQSVFRDRDIDVFILGTRLAF